MKSSIPLTFGDKVKSDFSFTRIAGDEKYAVSEHWHDCFEIIMVQTGSFKVILDGREHILTKGDIAIIPPRVLHGTESVEEYREVYVFGYVENLIYSPELSLINMKYLALFRYGTGTKYFVLPAEKEETKDLCRLIMDVMQIYNRDSFEREIRIRAKILDMHACVCSAFLGNHTCVPMQDGYLMDVQLYIEQHICEDISPYAVAEAVHLSYSHLSRLVRNAYGCSLGTLIVRMKINRSENLMTADCSASITDIALQAGFNSASYFTRCFRRMKGITPQKFRSMLNRTGL